MRVETFLALLVITLSTPSFTRYTDYQKYLNQWKKVVTQRYTHNVTDVALDTQLCYDKKCQFFYYESEDPSIIDPIRQKTVLLVAGMHGNQFLGPHTLLYAYPHLKAYKIIYFPMANPSGFNRQTRETFPGKIDPNRDYPIDGNTQCYQASATHIIDMLFRKYRFDLTVILHNGGTQIAFNWGTNKHVANSHTEQYKIYLDIAQMMRQAGGHSDSLQLKPFTIGTMSEVIYPASGTFDDWAYAVGKYPDIITKCNTYQYQPYPKGMANGLAFLIEMGPFSTNVLGSEEGIEMSPLSSNRHNGHIARVIRILSKTMEVINPQLSIQIEKREALLGVKGCKQAKIQQLIIFAQDANKSWVTVYQQSTNLHISKNGNIPIKIQLLSEVYQNTLIRFKGNLLCDWEWVGKGTTSFSKLRLFAFENIETSAGIRKAQEQPPIDLIQIAAEWKYQIGIIIVLIVLAFLVYRRCSRKNKIEKFQEVEFVGREREQGETQEQMGGDLHTARGGIINM